jgi:hypothetical protein
MNWANALGEGDSLLTLPFVVRNISRIADPRLELQLSQQTLDQRECRLDSILTRTATFLWFNSR